MSGPPDALLLMGRQCPYCPTMLQHLEKLQTEGSIAALETVILEDHPELARELGVRSVPWVRIGSFALAGLRSEQELRDWAHRTHSADGRSRYLAELSNVGDIASCLKQIKADNSLLRDLLAVFTDPESELNVRIGISAVMESLADTPALHAIAAELRALLTADDARVRGDACYYLSLSGTPDAADWIRPLLQDSDSNIREIAGDCLQDLEGGN